MCSPMLIASDVLRNDFDESKAKLLAQAWKVALIKAKSFGWLDSPKLRGRHNRLAVLNESPIAKSRK
jgi:hypothetical protein